MSFKVRPAVREDCAAILGLVRELADYERMLDQARLTATDLEEHLFSDDELRLACTNVATTAAGDGECDGERVIGFVLYFFVFDPLTLDRVAYMDELYVQPAHRGRGVGLALWRSVADHGLRRSCKVLNFEVLDWNAPSLEFYAKRGATNITRSRGYQHLRFSASPCGSFLNAQEGSC
ncbi:diamine acetyltransferase 1-like [Dermacentor silvarum]|uniref:diamine acetyltransferase 1-like n=1 Tax=Dermacentor silvarum TaxID=543639 RepID=UPI0018974313|nr:diamine acetyltransferase 1-like [Dermacentor silvarum]